MNYYMTNKGGSMILRKPSPKMQILAGERIPQERIDANLTKQQLQGLIAEGAIVQKLPGEALSGDDLGKPDVDPKRIGTGDKDFMPEVQALPGRQKDAALERLLEEQARAKEQTEVDPEAGGSPDGAVKVELPADPDEDSDYDELMSDAERDAVDAIDAIERSSDIFDDDED